MSKYAVGLRNRSGICRPVRWDGISSFLDATVHLPMSLLGSVQTDRERGGPQGGPASAAGGRRLQVTRSTIVSWWLQGRAGTCVQHLWLAACGWSSNGWSQARCQKGNCSGPGCTCSPSSATASCAWSPGCSWEHTTTQERDRKHVVSSIKQTRLCNLNDIFWSDNIQKKKTKRLQPHWCLQAKCFCQHHGCIKRAGYSAASPKAFYPENIRK